ncbi:hypothetical protein QYM36_012779 [Artemia franciscana]|uniref:Uncharacterized protein n=2 Tax=Artemia franciscana TaxID=6661 RepID=A0AA88HI86_ARTSF|nr:hypothetical protein QYM36_012779 [Artemia franciscana]
MDDSAGIKGSVVSKMNEAEIRSWFFTSYSYCDTKFDECYNLLSNWIEFRTNLIQDIEAVTKDLESNFQSTKKSKIIGSSAGVVGGTLSLTGIVLAPVTAATSLILTAFGTVVSGAGMIAMGSSVLKNGSSTKKICAGVQAKLEDDIEMSRELKTSMVDISAFCKEFFDLLENNEQLRDGYSQLMESKSGSEALIKMKMWILLTRLYEENEEGINGIVRDFKIDPILMSRLTRTILVTASQEFIAAQASLGLIGIGINIADIIVSSKDLKDDSQNESLMAMENLLVDLKKELRSIKVLKNYLDEAIEREIIRFDTLL